MLGQEIKTSTLSAERKRLGKKTMDGRFSQQNYSLSTKSKVCLVLPKRDFIDPRDVWENLLWTSERKVDLLKKLYHPFHLASN